MELDLEQFESQIHALILHRGKDYMLKGLVHDLEQNDDGWSATVQSTTPYKVRLLGESTFDSWNCECPFDHGPVCKHIAAVLYLIKANQDYQEEEIEMVKSYMDKLSHEEIRTFLNEAFEIYPSLRQHFLTIHYKSLSEEKS